MAHESTAQDDTNLLIDPRMLPHVEKDADDPSDSLEDRAGSHRQTSTTFTTLTRLLGSHPAPSPEASRAPSYVTQTPTAPYHYQRQSKEVAALPDHLLTRGLQQGKHSDITVKAFGISYKLHRIIIDRAPFFATAFGEPWLEAHSKEIDVRPDDIDINITQQSFELALEALYRGHADTIVDDESAIGLFATGCWLEMPDLVEASIEAILRQMTTSNLGQIITLVTSNYYGRAGDKVLASAKAMLCREGWKMPTRYWDDIPAVVIQELVGGDGFFVLGEWERWTLTRKLLNRRLKARANGLGLTMSVEQKQERLKDASSLTAIRSGSTTSSQNTQFAELYSHPQISPLTSLLDNGIHYIHLEFEQLQYIRTAKDCFGFLLLPERIISNALWQQMELRQRIMNARDTDLDLGLAIEAGDGPSAVGDSIFHFGSQQVEQSDDKTEVLLAQETEKDKDHRFWIPAADCNIVMGGNAEPVFSMPNATATASHSQQGRLSADGSQPRHESTTLSSHNIGADGNDHATSRLPATYTALPPFRFSAEFPSPKSLKEKKRVYSRTVFYAGSLWNIYIQKVASTRSAKQLGVYLHRAKEREIEEAMYAAGGSSLHHGNVEGRIGQLEWEMGDRTRRSHRESANDREDDDSTDSIRRRSHQSSINPLKKKSRSWKGKSRSQPPQLSLSQSSDNEATTSDDDDLDTPTQQTRPNLGIPALPPYVDARPTIKTYFKIYSPSRGGRMLSVYESAPDKFNFSQSWGWKSSTLMLDEGLMSQDEIDHHVEISEALGSADDGGREEGAADLFADVSSAFKEEGVSSRKAGSMRDGKLRFMVVIGNI